MSTTDCKAGAALRFHEAAHRIVDAGLRATCLKLLEESRLFTWPAAITHHHNYAGGLLEHTLEVLEYAEHIAEAFPEVNMDVLRAAALWHDVGKVIEYTKITDGWERPREAQSNLHIVSSSLSFLYHADSVPVRSELREAVRHCVLAHHGPVKEWGSPEAPATLEALILHQADVLSAHYGATR